MVTSIIIYLYYTNPSTRVIVILQLTRFPTDKLTCLGGAAI